MSNITIGCDPELFLRDPSGVFVSAHDLIPGDKMNPHPVPRGAIQVDGVSAEFNIEPATTTDEFVGNISTVMATMEAKIKEMRPDLQFAIEPTATFTEEYFASLPMSAKLLGCSPDFNAYTMAPNDPPHTDQPFRTGAGHVHVGWGSGFDGPEHFSNCCQLVKQLDCVLFIQSLAWDSDDRRRSLYGNIGAFRSKPYGLEYRPLSNAFLKSDSIQRWVFGATQTSAEAFFGGVKFLEDPVCENMVSQIIAGEKPGLLTIKRYMTYMTETYGVPSYE